MCKNRAAIVRIALTSLVGAYLLGVGEPSARAQPGVYEGWDYPAGDQSGISPGGGDGWSPGSGYSGPLAVVAPGLTHPAALPATGNALGATVDTPSISISRPFASPLDSTQTLWMSFLGRRDGGSAAYTVSLQQLSGNRTFSATFGADVDPSSGEVRYKARWENVGFFVSGGDAFALKPLSALGVTDLFLVRINPADTAAGTQTFDMWVNPDPASLGLPDASVAWPSAARAWSQAHYSFSGSTVDELRIDADMANVVAIPAPASMALLSCGATYAARRRRYNRTAQL